MDVDAETESIIAAALGAINRRDPVALRAVLAPEAELLTGRGEHVGVEQVIAWAQKRYEHLDKRYELDELRTEGDHVVALARVQYVWRESGEVGNEAPIALLFELEGHLVTRLGFFDDVDSALAAARA
jgi:hypothetical protein